ncbi:MAG: nucleotidyltransferase family protein [Betaproteobacteria bacterium]|nr:nucleotidyltransferase family protein [Betaproteobacteria bacterium]
MGCPLKGGGGLYSRMVIAAVLLAAGEGKRFGGIAKPAIELQGVPLIKRALFALSGAGVDEVAVVLGHQAELVGSLVQDFPVTLVRNDNYREGQMSSVHAGLAQLSGKFDAVLVCLADQPLINAQDLISLIAAYKQRDGGNVVAPRVKGQRGNPIIFDWHTREQILAGEKNLGCRQFIEGNPELVRVFDTDNDHFVVDLDTEDDLQRLEKRLGMRLKLPTAATALA